MGFMWRCTECRTKVPYSADMPEFCPNPKCSFRLRSDRPDEDVVMPAFLSAGTRANDKVYRDMERASEHRVQQAAEMAGVPASEMSNLKITNLNDHRHEGAVAAQMVTAANNPVMANMQVAQQQGAPVGMNSQAGLYFSGGTTQGPHPNRGARFQQQLRQAHAGHGIGAVTSEVPSLEVQNPAYRRRV